MINIISKLGIWVLDLLSRIGQAVFLFLQIIVGIFDFRKNFLIFLTQLYRIGFRSLVIIATAALFIGMVITLQGYDTLNQFGTTNNVGQLLSLSILRELGPVVTGLLFVGRAGSALTAEIGYLKISDQIHAMEIMAVDPVRRVLAPRYLAAVISLPLLTAIFNAVAIFGGYLIAVFWLKVDQGSFWGIMKANTLFIGDVSGGLVKSIVFGVLIALIAIYQGSEAEPTARGIGLATTKSVVYSSLVILGSDLIMTALIIAF